MRNSITDWQIFLFLIFLSWILEVFYIFRNPRASYLIGSTEDALERA